MTHSAKNSKSRLHALRDAMKRHDLDAYYVPTADPHNSEYLADHWKSRAWMSGFTGSAGTLVVTQYAAALWTDSRYFLQAEEELSESEIVLMREGENDVPAPMEWVRMQCGHDTSKLRVGLDFATCSTGFFESVFSEFDTIDVDLFDEIWKDRPAMPKRPISIFPNEWTEKNVLNKLEIVRAHLRENSRADYYLLNDISEIAWTLNLRGADIDYNPVFLSYLLVGREEAYLFVAVESLDDGICFYLAKYGISIRAYDGLEVFLRTLTPSKTVVKYAATLNRRCVELLDRSGTAHRCTPEPFLPKLRAVKDEREIAGFRRAMELDGIALVRFRRRLDEIIEKGKLTEETELTVAANLEKIRAEHPDYCGLSFATISAYGAHGAIVHYEPDASTDARLDAHGFLLLDSGAHYTCGTTDITRTIPLGSPSQEECRAYTLVLKGHIALARARFPEKTCGISLDFAARSAMWRAGMDFGHGTGHGVGSRLCVHEGPQQIRKNATAASLTPIVAGMTVTNEPGLYFTGNFGVRLENVLLTREYEKTAFGTFLDFETLTLCPFDTAPIDLELIDETELKWLNDYHTTVRERLMPLLTDEKDRAWLEKATETFPSLEHKFQDYMRRNFDA